MPSLQKQFGKSIHYTASLLLLTTSSFFKTGHLTMDTEILGQPLRSSHSSARTRSCCSGNPGCGCWVSVWPLTHPVLSQGKGYLPILPGQCRSWLPQPSPYSLSAVFASSLVSSPALGKRLKSVLSHKHHHHHLYPHYQEIASFELLCCIPFNCQPSSLLSFTTRLFSRVGSYMLTILITLYSCLHSTIFHTTSDLQL